jgi:hypothetical protein
MQSKLPILLVLLANICCAQKTGTSNAEIRIFVEKNHPEFGDLAYTHCDYKNGKKNGKCLVESPAGEVLAEISFINDKKYGAAILYFKKKIKEQALFENDKLIFRQVYIKAKPFKSEYYEIIADSSVLKEVYLYRWGGRKWIYRLYEGSNLKKEISYNRKGRVRLYTEY